MLRNKSIDAFDEQLIPVLPIATAGRPPGTTESDKAVKSAIRSYNKNVLLTRSFGGQPDKSLDTKNASTFSKVTVTANNDIQHIALSKENKGVLSVYYKQTQANSQSNESQRQKLPQENVNEFNDYIPNLINIQHSP